MMRRPQPRFGLLTGGLRVSCLAAPPAPVALEPAVYQTALRAPPLVCAPPVHVGLVPQEEAPLQRRSLRDYTRIGALHANEPFTQPPFGGVVASATLHAFPALPSGAAPKPQDPPAIQRSHGCTLW